MQFHHWQFGQKWKYVMSLPLHNTTMIMILVERGYIEYKLNSMPLFTTFNGMLNMAYCKYSRFLIVSLWQNMMPNRRIMHHEEIGEERISGKQYDVRQREKAKASWSERAARRHNGNCSCSAVSVSVICHLIENLLQVNVNCGGTMNGCVIPNTHYSRNLWNFHCKCVSLMRCIHNISESEHYLSNRGRKL